MTAVVESCQLIPGSSRAGSVTNNTCAPATTGSSPAEQEAGAPPVAILDQFASLPELLSPADTQEIQEIVLNALAQRELEHADPDRCADLRGRLDRVRERHDLPGPARDRRTTSHHEGA